MTCTADACKICTDCYHGRHEKCGRTITCPSTGEITGCRCCGIRQLPEPEWGLAINRPDIEV